MRDLARQNAPAIEELEGRVEELERISDSLTNAPDGEVVETLERAIHLLSEVNDGIEAALRSANEESERLGTVLENVGFDAFDEVLGELEDRERTIGDPRP